MPNNLTVAHSTTDGKPGTITYNSEFIRATFNVNDTCAELRSLASKELQEDENRAYVDLDELNDCVNVVLRLAFVESVDLIGAEDA